MFEEEMILKESETLELKKSTSELKEAIISTVSILNKHQKGTLYFGIKNNGEIVGQDVSENTLRKISRVISDNVEPKIYPKISEIILDQRQCIKVEFSGYEAPYFAYGRAYIRVADENKKLTVAELERFFSKKRHIYWDTQFSGESLSEINTAKLKEYIKKDQLSFYKHQNGIEKTQIV